MATNWTPQQKSAIDARNSTVLVSAAAGSGKTAVLTERAICRMLDSANPIDADRLMVVTFTRAAAKEMKQRMMKKLADKIEEQPDNAFIRKQRLLLERAVIGTIDSLCLSLLQQNRQILSLPAEFRVGDEQEIEEIFSSSADEVFEAYFENNDEGFKELIDLFEKRHGDQSLEGAISSILTFAKSHPFYLDWLTEKSKLYSDFTTPEQSPWGDILMEYAEHEAAKYITIVENVLECVQNDSDFSSYFEAIAHDLDFFTELLKETKSRNWNACCKIVSQHEFLSLGRAKKGADESAKNYIQAHRKNYKAFVEKLGERIFYGDANTIKSDAEYLGSRVSKLFELAKETDRVMMRKKYSEGVFDFSDIEQFAVELLIEKTENGYAPNKFALEIQNSFDEIMVDEYQDVNAVQDMIINAVSNGENLFMVGDVKQSIYRFRQAKPEIFIARSEEYSKPDNGSGRLITLSGNFRSRSQIIDAANNIFEPLFSKRVGEIVYDDSHKLNAMASYPKQDDAGVTFCVLEQGDMLSVQAAEAEAQFAAEKIKQMLDDKIQVCEKGVMRDIKPSDIAILLRSVKGQAEIYKKALESCGVSAFANLENGFLDSNEVQAIICFLQAVKNPTKDIELIGAMLSPLFGITDEKMADIRAENKRGIFYNAVLKYAEKDEQTAYFISVFEKTRRLSLTADAVEVINFVIGQTEFDIKCRLMENGEQRFSNVLMLCQYAQQFHKNGKRGLFAFLSAIDRIVEQKKDLAPAATEQKNSVTITSIHKSKGLEWPVVLLCAAGRDFGFFSNDVKKPIALHSELGFACVRRDKQSRAQFTTAMLEAVKIASVNSQLSEELRVLYVAITRASEKLIITASIKNAEQAAFDTMPESGRLTPEEVSGCKNYARWILSALNCYGNAADALFCGEEIGGIKLELIQPKADEKKEEEQPEAEQTNSLEKAEDAVSATEAAQMAAQIKSRLEFEYPYLKQTKLPAKISVSEITHDKSGGYRFGKKPRFSQNSAAGNERGTAVHTYMQFCDYALAAADADKELSRLVNEGILTRNQGELVDTAVIKRFFESKLYARIEKADEIRREFAFMVSAADCPSISERYSCGDEATMLQGIADGVFFENGKAVIIDYKTDRVKAPEQLIKRYSNQLILYKEMLQSVLKTEISECIIWSFALGKEIKIC